LNGLDSGIAYSNAHLQVMIGAFCLSPLVGQLLDKPVDDPSGENYSFAQEGDLQEEDYAQDSIYAILYAMYKNAPELISEYGVKYQFTFNTWGIAPSDAMRFEPYPQTDPQRHGKQAYEQLLVQPPVREYLESLPEGQKPQIIEVGCGTGAGANHITRKVYPNADYLALDMQQAAINTCNSLHATPDNAGLTCMRIPNGVGINGGKIPRDDNSADVVVISETHIAESEVGPLEKSIFAEIHRVLKPGGFFVWGNALPTRVWHQGNAYLPTAGFELAFNTNHTIGAVNARDEDFARVELTLKQLLEPYYVIKMPYFGERCAQVGNRLIANFYRHPGTAMYLKMTTGTDSYVHQAWKAVK
jgi:ubiquinone/menaquinone biosynthesis C-methylase UbiE